MNYYCFKQLFGYGYMYVDAYINDHYVADSIFIRNRIPIKFEETFESPDSDYCICFCKVKKAYKEEMEKSFQELKTKMALLGFLDYESFCNEMFKTLNLNDEEKSE